MISRLQLRAIVPSLALAIILIALGIWGVLSNFNYDQIKDALKQSRPEWIVMGISAGVLGSLCKALRWRYQIQASGGQVSIFAAFTSIMFGLSCDFLAPRIGEVARAYVVREESRLPLSVLVGALITDRGTDLLFLLLVMAVAVFSGAYSLGTSGLTLPFSTWVIALVLGALLITGIALWSRSARHVRFWTKALTLFQGIKSGIVGIFHSPYSLHFIGLCFLTWLGYYLQTSLSMKAFFLGSAIDSHHAALFIFVSGLIGMLIPIQGGVGSYHLLVSAAIVSLGGDPMKALAFATLLHLAYSLATIAIGILSWLIWKSMRPSKTKRMTTFGKV
jgi:uncharacterized membrane protein YbhN (UPF0104 family)